MNRCEDCLENCLALQSRQEVEPGSLQHPQYSTQIYQIYEIYEIYENYGIVAQNIQTKTYNLPWSSETSPAAWLYVYTLQYMLLLNKPKFFIFTMQNRTFAWLWGLHIYNQYKHLTHFMTFGSVRWSCWTKTSNLAGLTIMHSSAYLKGIYTVRCILCTILLHESWDNVDQAKQMPEPLQDFTAGIFIMQNRRQAICMAVPDNNHARQRSHPLHDCKTHIFTMQNRIQAICKAVLFDNYRARQRSDPLHDCNTYIFTMQERDQSHYMTVRPIQNPGHLHDCTIW